MGIKECFTNKQLEYTPLATLISLTGEIMYSLSPTRVTARGDDNWHWLELPWHFTTFEMSLTGSSATILQKIYNKEEKGQYIFTKSKEWFEEDADHDMP